MKFYCKIAVVLCLIAGLNACKSSKQSTVEPGGQLSTTDEEYFETMLDHELQYQTWSCKMNIEFKSKSKISGLSGSLKLVKDKALQISVAVPIFGIEGFRMKITPDSVIALDRLNQRYIAEEISNFKTKEPVLDFNTLQALFTNRLFIPGKKEVTKSDYSSFNVNRKNDQMLFTLKGNRKFNFTFTGNYTHHIVSSFIGMEASDYLMDWKYSSFGDVAGVWFPSQIGVQITAEGKNLNVDMSLSKMEKDKNINVDFSIPDKYRRTDINYLINLLMR
jgi:hypothetical protein